MNPKRFWKKKEQSQMRCYHCNRSVSRNVHPIADNRATIDHLIPLSKGGKDNFSNTVVSCFKCNSQKADKLDFQPKHQHSSVKQDRDTKGRNKAKCTSNPEIIRITRVR